MLIPLLLMAIILICMSLSWQIGIIKAEQETQNHHLRSIISTLKDTNTVITDLITNTEAMAETHRYMLKSLVEIQERMGKKDG